MRLLIILLCCISYVIPRPQNSENNGYQYNIDKNTNSNRLSNPGLSQKIITNLQSVTNNNYLPPTQINNNIPLPIGNLGNLEITKSIGITAPEGDDNGILQESQNILEQSGLLNGIHNANNNILSDAVINIPKNNKGKPTQSGISYSTDNSYQNQQQLNPFQPQYSPSYQNYAPNYNSNGIISPSSSQLQQRERNIYVHLPSSLEQYQQQQQPPPQLPPRTHYKIIFVKAPNRPTPPPQPIEEVEEKTLVYVLVQKPEIPSADEIQAIQQKSIKSSKPEVYFIKYKTGQTEPGNIQSSLESDLPQIDDNNGNLIKNSINSGLTLTSSANINDGSQQNQRINDNRPKHLYDAPN